MYEPQSSKYGALAQALPFTFGKVFFVTNSSDVWVSDALAKFFPDRDGVVRMFTSLSAAYDATVTGRNDVIILDSNGTHTLTSMLTVAKNRVHFVGLDWLLGVKRRNGARSKVSLTALTGATNIATVKVTGVGCSFRGIKFMNSSTVAEGIYCFADGGEYTYLENCEIYKDTDLDQTGAAELVANGDSSVYKNCFIGSIANDISGAIIRPCVTMTQGIVGTCRDVSFEGCIFARSCGNTANRFVYGANADALERMGLFENCIFWNSALAAATPAQNVAFGASLTKGSVLLRNCTAIGGATAMSTTTGVFIDGPVPAADTTGIALQTS